MDDVDVSEAAVDVDHDPCSVAIAGAITFVEPLVNTVAHYFFDKAWESGRLRAPWAKKGGAGVSLPPAAVAAMGAAA